MESSSWCGRSLLHSPCADTEVSCMSTVVRRGLLPLACAYATLQPLVCNHADMSMYRTVGAHVYVHRVEFES